MTDQLFSQINPGVALNTILLEKPVRRESSFVGERSSKAPLPRLSLVPEPKIAILLCTYQGQQYLEEQLDSIADQTHHNWEIWASDDGSDDNTLTILEAYRQKWPKSRLTIQSGPRNGFAANFISLACNPDIQADFYAYSDQDDIWQKDKLARAAKWLESVPPDIPAMYCSRTLLVDADNNEIGLSKTVTKPPCFGNALAQIIGGGNTIMFNHAACQLLREAGPDLDVFTHDWWTYLVVTGSGGKVFYDPQPSLRYRQHDHNLMGMNNSWRARAKRIRMLWQGCFRTWNDNNIAALNRLNHRLTPENQEKFGHFVTARQMSLLPRLVYLYRSGLHRQTLLGNLGLLAAAIFKKL